MSTINFKKHAGSTYYLRPGTQKPGTKPLDDGDNIVVELADGQTPDGAEWFEAISPISGYGYYHREGSALVQGGPMVQYGEWVNVNYWA